MAKPYVLLSCGVFGPAQRKAADYNFDINYPYTLCRLCGTVFQALGDRLPNLHPHDLAINAERRRLWSHHHARTHSLREHNMLELSGRFATPEATEILVSYGIVPVSDLVLSNEHEMAGLEAKNIPNNDVQGVPTHAIL